MVLIQSKRSSTMRSGWTLIELIFIIVIIAILAAVAIPRLAATRDDAKLVADVSKMSRCITDAGSKYTAAKIKVSVGDSPSCDNVECYTWEWTNTDGFKVEIKVNSPTFCTRVNDIGAHLAITHLLAGSSVSY